MSFDSIVLAAVTAELNGTLTGGRIDKIHQPTPLDIVMTIRNNGANYMLLVSADAQTPRVHLTSIKRPNPQTAPNFCMLLRKYLEGGRFIGAEQIDFDRILHLNFLAYDGERYKLVVEIMGKHSNTVLINDTRTILGVIKPIGRLKSRYREVLPGRIYIAPPSQNKTNPLLVSRTDFDTMVQEVFDPAEIIDGKLLADWLMKSFTGISPFAARELAARSGGSIERLSEEFIDFFNNILSNAYSPVLITNAEGLTIDFYVFPSLQYPAENQHERSSVDTLADMYYNSALPRKALEQAKEEFINLVQKELRARKNACNTIRENVVSDDGTERFKQLGELILSQTASIPPSADSVELVDYYDPNGAMVKVTLNPQLTPPENAEAYFRKFRKAVSGALALRDRLIETEKEVSILERTLTLAHAVTTPEQVKELMSDLESQGVTMRKQEQAAAAKEKPEFEGFKISKVTSNGWEILIGQNSLSNDYLIQRVAKPSDIWLHVKASASAHVVIRTNGKPDSVPRSVLYAAAEQAVQHSTSKHSSMVPVDYTQRRYVRKPRGSAPGKVIYQNEKTLYVDSA